MNSIERKRTLAKIVLVVSTFLLIVLLLNQIFPNIFSASSTTDVSSSSDDLGDVYKQFQKQYDDRTAGIKAANENAINLNATTIELNSYSDKNIPMYAIGGGLSIIMGLWISTIIFYFKESRGLFKK